MKPDERIRLFREGVEAYASGDLEAALAYYHPEVEVTAPQWMNSNLYKGHEGFIKWAESWDEAWDSFSWEIKSVEAVGERHVVARVRLIGKGRGSAIELDHEAGYVVDVQDGKAIYLEITRDEDSAREIAHEREVSN